MPTANPDHIDRIVEQWRRERPDLDTSALALMGRLFRVVQLAGERLGAPLAEHGLQRGWFDLLAALRRAGPPFELNPTELMRATMLSSGGTTKRLDRLEEAGLIVRRADPDDRRGTRVRLTRRGRARIDRALERHVANEERLLSGLSGEQRRALDGLLRALLAELDPEPDVPDRSASPRAG
jgi:DNA-binding MarR family transcriptional regulator